MVSSGVVVQAGVVSPVTSFQVMKRRPSPAGYRSVPSLLFDL
jgi:hypothetical protein